jgi:HD-GYP domain-containing protein (c-di-GMP phosphodiesterase class II)
VAGEEIPLGARIVAVVDAYDAMTTDSPYRAAMPHERAAEILRGGAGSQWDPRIVQAFLSALASEQTARRAA